MSQVASVRRGFGVACEFKGAVCSHKVVTRLAATLSERSLLLFPKLLLMLALSSARHTALAGGFLHLLIQRATAQPAAVRPYPQIQLLYIPVEWQCEEAEVEQQADVDQHDDPPGYGVLLETCSNISNTSRISFDITNTHLVYWASKIQDRIQM